MPTIKTKKEMNLAELIEWATSNDITNTFAKLKSQWPLKQGIRINNDGRFRIVEMEYLSKNNIFTVEVEEEITEDTVFDKLISRYVFLSSKPSYAHSINTCIKEFIEDRKVATHIYLENEDNELQLIWTKEKGLVE
ncbi:hypothetical protein [Mammaliicoccus sciuri]|uniref:hypothetical protein n=1 Tax=Mammaliicoccus sciuri TaxID=1296 RepID=UPI001E38D861|nr:hypothetical protein [Mammaliicoccus sciuri]MCD8770810.1 hypothetical protein [Mammaliicoccus sciuri]